MKENDRGQLWAVTRAVRQFCLGKNYWGRVPQARWGLGSAWINLLPQLSLPQTTISQSLISDTEQNQFFPKVSKCTAKDS